MKNQISMEENTPINKTVFSEEFCDVDSSEIVLLAKVNALSVWQKYIDAKASSYFGLSDENWIIKSNKSFRGKWITDFNNKISKGVEEILNSSTLWKDSDVVYFSISKYIIIESPWGSFKKLWIRFLECEDDCPILINKNGIECAIIFFPIGNIIKVES